MNLWRRFSGRNDCDSVLLDDGVPQRFRVVTFVAKDMPGWKIGDEICGLGVIARLPRRENEAQRIAHRIDYRVYLGGQPAA